MYPTLQQGQRIKVVKRSTLTHFDIVIFQPPTLPEEQWLGRVLALDNDLLHASNNVLYLNGTSVAQRVGHPDLTFSASVTNTLAIMPPLSPLQVPNGHVFVAGDNCDVAYDSRFFGPIEQTRIFGVVVDVR